MVSDNVVMKICFNWNLTVTTITIFVSFFVCFLIFILFKYPPSPIIKWILIVSLLLPLLYFAFFYTPIGLVVSQDNIKIKNIVRNISIPMETITDIKIVEWSEIGNSLRTFGSGGFFGYTGRFKHPKIGSFEMYVTDTKQLIYIKTNDKSFVISCVKADELINYYYNGKTTPN